MKRGVFVVVAFLGLGTTVATAQIPILPGNPPPEQPPTPQPPAEPGPPVVVDKPGQLSIRVTRSIVRWGGSVRLYGFLRGRTHNGGPNDDQVLVEARVDSHPFGSPNTVPTPPIDYTNGRGRYSLGVAPVLNTRYRICSASYGPRGPCSRVVTVYVLPEISLSFHRSQPGRIRFQYRADGGDYYIRALTARRRARRVYFYVRDPLMGRYVRAGSARLKRPRRNVFAAHLIRRIDALLLRADRSFACTKVAPIRGMGRPGRFAACGRRSLPG